MKNKYEYTSMCVPPKQYTCNINKTNDIILICRESYRHTLIEPYKYMKLSSSFAH